MAVTMTRSAGMLVLAIYLIVIGLAGLYTSAIPLALTALLALLAGVLILVGRLLLLSRDAAAPRREKPLGWLGEQPLRRPIDLVSR